eukprot:351068-Chlamydomonas_euryale.AAC.2
MHPSRGQPYPVHAAVFKLAVGGSGQLFRLASPLGSPVQPPPPLASGTMPTLEPASPPAACQARPWRCAGVGCQGVHIRSVALWHVRFVQDVSVFRAECMCVCVCCTGVGRVSVAGGRNVRDFSGMCTSAIQGCYEEGSSGGTTFRDFQVAWPHEVIPWPEIQAAAAENGLDRHAWREAVKLFACPSVFWCNTGRPGGWDPPPVSRPCSGKFVWSLGLSVTL